MSSDLNSIIHPYLHLPQAVVWLGYLVVEVYSKEFVRRLTASWITKVSLARRIMARIYLFNLRGVSRDVMVRGEMTGPG